MRTRIAKLRSGTSLIELMAVVSACSVILTTTTMLIHRVMRADEETRRFADVERNAQRLSDQFRRDVHQATAAMLDKSKLRKGAVLRLDLPDGEALEYRRLDGDVSRILLKNDKVAAREEYTFPQAAEIAVRELTSPRRVVLSITSPLSDTVPDATKKLRLYMSTPVSLQVEACLSSESVSANAIKHEQQPR